MAIRLYNKGITAIELLIVIGIVVVIGVITVPSLVSFRKDQALQNTTNAVVSLLQEARTKTTASYNNTVYSVILDTTSATMFTGTTYSASEPTNKVVSYEAPIVRQSITLNGGGSTVTFDRLKGTTAQHGTLVLGITGGASKTVTLSPSGVITRD